MSGGELPGEPELEEAAKYFHALGNKLRLKIILLLLSTDRPLHIKAISRRLKTSYPAIYRHITTLREAGIIRIYEVGRSRVVTLRDPESHLTLIRMVGKHKS